MTLVCARTQMVLVNSTRGDPQSVLDAIDAYGHRHWLMNVGDVKVWWCLWAARSA